MRSPLLLFIGGARKSFISSEQTNLGRTEFDRDFLRNPCVSRSCALVWKCPQGTPEKKFLSCELFTICLCAETLRTSAGSSSSRNSKVSPHKGFLVLGTTELCRPQKRNQEKQEKKRKNRIPPYRALVTSNFRIAVCVLPNKDLFPSETGAIAWACNSTLPTFHVLTSR